MAQDPSRQVRSACLTLSFTRDGQAHQVAIGRWGLAAAGTAAAALTIWGAVAATYLTLREDVLGGLLTRQTRMQYAYEDRIAALRTSIDRLTSRQLLDQDSFTGKVQELIARQAQLENRQAMVAALTAQLESLPRTGPGGGTSSPPVLTQSQGALPLAMPKGQGGPLPSGTSAFAPLEPARPAPALEPMPLRGSDTEARAPSKAPATGFGEQAWPERELAGSGPVQQRLGSLAAKLAQFESDQVRTLARLETHARRAATRYQSVLSELGLDRARFQNASAQGGPLVPVKVDPNAGPFEAGVSRAQMSLAEYDSLRRTIDSLPLRRPLRGDLDQTSGFGYRVDPFTRGMALHTGLDFRDEYAAPVRVTAPGKVVTADWNGGYGNMVEVDHGNGVTTRYAHLSAILVQEGQKIEAGSVVGRLGSTGRSTGPHLHYETRIDGEPVDPIRYLRAASKHGLF